MQLPRPLAVLLTTVSAFALLAPAALADAQTDHGEGLLGELNDMIITEFGFIVIAGFPLFCLLASIAYHFTEKRREARWQAEKARMARTDLRGGW